MRLLEKVALPPSLAMSSVTGVMGIVHSHCPKRLIIVLTTEINVHIQLIRAITIEFLYDPRRPFLGNFGPVKPGEGKLMNQRVCAGIRLGSWYVWKYANIGFEVSSL